MKGLHGPLASFETVAPLPPQDDESGKLAQTFVMLRSEAQAERLEARNIVPIARAWLGTPYRHQASVRGVGCDCLGLVRGVWRELHGAEAEPVPAYRPDWAEVSDSETLLDAARRWLTELPLSAIQPGDVLLFRMAPGALVKHCAILTALPNARDPQARMIHAYWGRAVVESWLGPWWRRRLVAVFRFPGE